MSEALHERTPLRAVCDVATIDQEITPSAQRPAHARQFIARAVHRGRIEQAGAEIDFPDLAMGNQMDRPQLGTTAQGVDDLGQAIAAVIQNHHPVPGPRRSGDHLEADNIVGDEHHLRRAAWRPGVLPGIAAITRAAPLAPRAGLDRRRDRGRRFETVANARLQQAGRRQPTEQTEP